MDRCRAALCHALLEAKAIAESKTAWQTLKKDVHWVEDKITAKVPKLQPVVDSMVNSLKATFSKSAVADQTGSPWAFMVGSMLKACIDNDGTCKVPKSID